MAIFNGWQAAMLHALGAPATPANLKFLNAWAQAEGGSASYNPFNTTQDAPGASSYNSVGVKNYASPNEGIRATVQTLLNGRYNPIVSGLRSGHATAAQLATAVANSPWGTGSGVLRVLGAGPVKGGVPTNAMGAMQAITGGGGGSGLNSNALLSDFLLQQANSELSPNNPNAVAQEGSSLLALAMARKALGSAASTPVNAGSGVLHYGHAVKGGVPGSAGGFLPQGMKFSYNRHDQGRDIQAVPGAPILAPGDGFVVRIASDPGGGGAHFGPRYPIVHFTSGPYAGRDVYIGHTVAALGPGTRFSAGTVLSHTQQSGPLNGGAPSGWAEIGFAPGGTPGADGQPAPF